MNFSDFIINFKKWCSAIMEEAEAQIIPDQKILVSHSNGKTQFYIRSAKERKGKYVKISDYEAELKPIAQSMYASNLLEMLRVNLSKINAIDETIQSLTKAWRQLPVEIQHFVSPFILNNSDFKKWWIEQPYEQLNFPKKEKHLTKKGDEVRSKAEWIIADALFDAGIPYRYEAPLQFLNSKVYPDFTVLQVHTQKVIYIEHLGMLSDVGYYKKAMEKIKSYQENGLLLGRDFLVTYEYQKDDFNALSVEGLIKQILLED